jgi:multidrug efflux system membrane fusion protein
VTYQVQSYYEYNGNLDAIEFVQVTARVKGFLDEILFTEGEEVKQGDLLKRMETLRNTGAASAEEHEQRAAARETAEAVVLQTEAALEASQLQFAYTEIRSPIAGQISRTLVTRGNLVGQEDNTLLTTIVSMDPLYVYFDVPERDLTEYLRSIQPGDPGDLVSRSIPVEVGVATETGYPHLGRIDFRENRRDMGTATVRIRGRVPNPRVPPANVRLLYPGLYTRVRVPAGDLRSMPVIPEDALMTGQEGRYVYVLGESNVVKKRTVTVGPQVWKKPAGNGLAGWTLVGGGAAEPVHAIVAIESGLTPDDRVILSGLAKARPGAPVAPEPRELKPPEPAERK